MWFWFSLLSMFFFAIQHLLYKVLISGTKLKGYDPAILGAYSKFWQFFLVLPFALWEKEDFSLTLPIILLLVLSMLIFTLAQSFYFKSLRTTDASEVALINSLAITISFSGGVFFLNESFSFLKLLGLILIIIGIIVLYGKETIAKLKILSQGEKYAYLSTIFYGFGSFLDRYIVNFLPAFLYLAINIFSIAIGIILFNKKGVKSFISLIKNKEGLRTILPGLFLGGASLSLFMAYKQGGEVSKVTPITSSSTLLVVWGSILFLNEKENILSKILAAFLVVVGVVFLK